MSSLQTATANVMPSGPSATADRTIKWAFLEGKLDHVMTKLPLDFKHYMNIHTEVYDYWTSSGVPTGTRCLDLYNHLIQYFIAHVKKIKDSDRFNSDSLEDKDLLENYNAEWDRYVRSAKCMNRMFWCLNKYWVKRQQDEGRKGIYPLYTLALVQWRDNFLYKHTKLARAIFRLIECQRNGDTIDQDLMKKVVDSFVLPGLDKMDINRMSLDVYRKHLETPFLDATEEYYEQESKAFLAESSVSDYLKKAEELLKEEDRVDRYLNTETRERLISKCEHVLIRQHSDQIWESFQGLLDSGKDEDLWRIYALLSRIPEGLEPLRKKFEEHVKKAGLAAVAKLSGEGSEGADSLDPKAYVDVLSEVRRKNLETVTRSFRGDAGFVASLDNACREFVNAATGSSTTKSPELLAKHADMLFAKITEEDKEL